MKNPGTLRVLAFCSLVLAALIALPHSAGAVGLSVTPSRMDLVAGSNGMASATVTVKNGSEDVALFSAYADAFVSEIRIAPQSFMLEAGESRTVAVSVNGKKKSSFVSDLSFVARPLSDTTFRAAGGIKIPLTFRGQGKRGVPSMLAALSESTVVPPVTLAGGLLAFIAIIAYRKKRIRVRW